MTEVRRDFCKSSDSTHLLKQGRLAPAAQDHVLSNDGDSPTSVGNLLECLPVTFSEFTICNNTTCLSFPACCTAL